MNIVDNKVDAFGAHPTEEKYPIQCEGFKCIIDNMYKTHLKKNQDYSPANIVTAGSIGVIIRIWDKFCRICNLSGVPFPSVQPKIISAKYELLQYFKPESQEYKRIESIFDNLIESSTINWNNIKPVDPANEPLKDAWLDMATYSVIGTLEHEGKWGR